MDRRELLRLLTAGVLGAGGFWALDSGLVSVNTSKLRAEAKSDESLPSPATTETVRRTSTGSPSPTPPDARAVSRQAHAAVNERRQAYDQDTVDWDPRLYEIARDYSQRMARQGFFGHRDPDGDNFADRYREADYHCSIDVSDTRVATGAENLARTYWGREVSTEEGAVTYETAKELGRGIVSQWMHSATHRRNILRNFWKNEAVGVYITGNGTVYATQNFC